MSGLCGLNSDGCRFGIADLSQHDDVRILAENRPETAGECHPRLAIELNLPDIVNPVFHRIFESHDIAVRTVQFIQDGINTGTLATARRTGA